ncbi:Ornithine decarboxylase [Gracilaria domingensis]|nr:Ornithine decarboxylase [Gracilaria domingensis]
MTAPLLSPCSQRTHHALPTLHQLCVPSVTSASPQQLLATLIHRTHSAIYAADLSVVLRQVNLFRTLLPDITPYYAVKCNPDPVLVNFLARIGLSFDCASRQEIDLVKDALRAPHGGQTLDQRMIFANPYKLVEDIKYVRSLGASLMTFDSVDELVKIHATYPHARLLLRIAVDDSHSLCPLSSKFGANLGKEISSILQAVSNYSLNLVGVAFHVGSACGQVQSYIQALHDARAVFDVAAEEGIQLSVLDIGGGFPGYDGDTNVTFRQIADAIRPLIRSLFPPHVRVIAEPGRFYASSAYNLAVKVVLTLDGERKRCYIADGIFGSFRDAFILNSSFEAKLLSTKSAVARQLCSYDLYGPSLDSADVIAKDVKLPMLEAGDWLHFENMGAYTLSLAAHRHQQLRYHIVYCFSNDECQ